MLRARTSSTLIPSIWAIMLRNDIIATSPRESPTSKSSTANKSSPCIAPDQNIALKKSPMEAALPQSTPTNHAQPRSQQKPLGRAPRDLDVTSSTYLECQKTYDT